jgi:hypothetical protein
MRKNFWQEMGAFVFVFHEICLRAHMADMHVCVRNLHVHVSSA